MLAVGAANMDISCSTGNPLVAGDSVAGQIRCTPGGVARNVAENLARLGHRVRLLSAVGDDAHGHVLLERTRACGVEVADCRLPGGAPTSTYVALHGPDGEMAAAVNDMQILEQITPDRLAPHAAAVRAAAALLLDCNLPGPALAWLFGQARDTPVFVDPVSAAKCRRLLPWLDRVHTLKANRIEVQALCGQPARDEAEIAAAARWLHERGVRNVVLSLGQQGVYWSEAGGARGWQAAVPVAVVSATGAGDALMAGLLHGYLQGDTLAAAAAFAAGCAALTLTSAAANHPQLAVAAVRRLLQSSIET